MKQPQRDWITGLEAAQLLSKRDGHTIDQRYIRYQAYHKRMIRFRPFGGRASMNEYYRPDVEALPKVKYMPGPPNRKPSQKQSQEETTATLATTTA